MLIYDFFVWGAVVAGGVFLGTLAIVAWISRAQ